MIWRLLWPLPWTLAGLLAGAVMCATGARAQRREGAFEFTGGRLGCWAARGPFSALTLGHVILAVSEDEARRLAAHERSHVRQYEAWGPLFVPAYLAAGAWQWLCGRCPHADNPFETRAVAP